VKALLVVIVVAGICGAGIYAMTSAEAPISGRRDFKGEREAVVSVRENSTEETGLLNPTRQQARESNPKSKETVDSVKETLPEEKKTGLPPRKPKSDDKFDPFMGERFSETEFQEGPLSNFRGAVPVGQSPEETLRTQEIIKIDKQVDKMLRNLTKKVNGVASRLKLDASTANTLRDISLDGLEQISDARKQFAGQAMTDSDRDYLRDTIKSINSSTAQSIYGLLGDDKYKQYKRESRYYDNPQARLLDEMNTIKKQNQKLQKKMDTQNRQSRPKRSGNWRGRR